MPYFSTIRRIEFTVPRKILMLIGLFSILLIFSFAGMILYDHYRVYRLTIATASEWGEYNKFGKALAKVVNRNQKKIILDVRNTSGSVENLKLLEEGRVQLAIAQNNVLADAKVSHHSLRAIALLFPEVFHILAAPGTGISEIPDLRGRKVALLSNSSGSRHLFRQIIHHYGLTEKDFTPLDLPPDKAVEMLKKRKVEALTHTMALGNTVVQKILKETGAKLIGVDEVAAMKISIPHLEETIIPKGTYGGTRGTPEKPIPAASVRAILLSKSTVPQEVIYEITKILYENRSELVTEYPYASQIQWPHQAQLFSVPLHRGAHNYYNQNKPSFLVEYAEVLGLIFSVVVLSFAGLLRLSMVFKDRQKNRADKHNIEILLLIEKIYEASALEELEEIHQKLLHILRQVIRDLDNDNISMEHFQSFTFTWETAMNTLQHYEMILTSGKKKSSTKKEPPQLAPSKKKQKTGKTKKK